MDEVIQKLSDFEWWKQALVAVDGFLFTLYVIAVAYLFCFALFSTGKIISHYKKSKKKHRFAVLFSAYMQDETIVESVESFLRQDYPRDSYDVIVISGGMSNETNEYLAGQPIRLMRMECEDNTKVQALQFAMSNLDEQSYDAVVVMDADNITSSDFLERINDAYNSGCMAIQTHRVGKNRDTDTAVLDAISEEINNSIFRRGHVKLGLSSALIGSGMVFDFKWFKNNIQNAKSIGVTKQLETMLLEQSVYIEYLDDVYTYEDKTLRKSAFYNQRYRWHVEQTLNLNTAIRKFPKALFAGNFDFCDKLFQWMLPSRPILFGSLGVIAFGLLFMSWILAIKWLGLLFVLVFVFSIAIPDYIVDAHFVRAIKTIPILLLLSVFNLLRRRIL